jgi:hypothetical protein
MAIQSCEYITSLRVTAYDVVEGIGKEIIVVGFKVTSRNSVVRIMEYGGHKEKKLLLR